MGGLAADGTLVTAGLLAAAAVTATATWLFVRKHRPKFGLRAAREALESGNHGAALEIAQRYRPIASASPQPWHEEQRHIETEALHASAESSLRNRRYAETLQTFRTIASLLRLDESDACQRVVDTMLSEVRLLSANTPDDSALPELIAEIFKQRSTCPEASFWLGISQLRHNETRKAIDSFTAATQAGTSPVDPYLYLGAIWLRDGSPRDALRVLSEANRLAPQCPLVSWLLGAAIVESGGDALLALRALQKATGTDGLPKYLKKPSRLWTETLPQDSWIRNVTLRRIDHAVPFRCPLELDRADVSLLRARIALAEALVTCQKAEDAIPIYTDLLKSHDTLQIRRGLGLALAQLERHDEALPHLRVAHSQENPPSSVTTSALALSLSHARFDPENIRQALELLTTLKSESDAIYARRAGAVFAAAQKAGLPISNDEIAKICDALVSTSAVDPHAAEAYNLLAGLNPNALPREAALLYTRAAQVHGLTLPLDEFLLDFAMGDQRSTRDYFALREWDFEAVELMYLQRWATRHPGTFPSAPGLDYAATVETSLLNAVQRQAAQGQFTTARELALLVLRLNPVSGLAYDRLAEIAFRRGNRAEATNWLKVWQTKCPNDPQPLARLALVSAANRNLEHASELLSQSLELVQGSARMPYLLMAARFAIAQGKRSPAKLHLKECLSFAPYHPTALMGRTAIAWAEGNTPLLEKLASRMASVPAEDPWFHYLAAGALLVAGNLGAAELSAKQAAADPMTASEGRHLLALVRARRNDIVGAAGLIRDASIEDAAVGHHAAAMRGQFAYLNGEYAEALHHWHNLPADRISAWNLPTVVANTAFLAGIQALDSNQPESAVQLLVQAARLGQDDARLESLLAAAYSRACRQGGASSQCRKLLEQLAMEGPIRPLIVQQLAHRDRRNGQLAHARRLLDRMPSQAGALEFERGMLALAQGQLVAAERAFVAACSHDAKSVAAYINLIFTRLSLGRLKEALEILPRAIELAHTPTIRRLLENLKVVASGSSEPPDGWTENNDGAMIQLIRSIGRLESIGPLFASLARIRGQSEIVRKAQAEMAQLVAISRLNFGDAAGARAILEAHSDLHRNSAARNLLGVAVALLQELNGAVRHFQAALPPHADDARIQQNLAIVRSWLGDANRSEAHWKRYLAAFHEQMAEPPGIEDYHSRIREIVQESIHEEIEAHARRMDLAHGK